MITNTDASAPRSSLKPAAQSALLSVPVNPGEVIYDPGCTADTGSVQGWTMLDEAMTARYGFGFIKTESSTSFRVADGNVQRTLHSYHAEFDIPNVGAFTLAGSAMDCGPNASSQTPVLFANPACRSLRALTDHGDGYFYSRTIRAGVPMRLATTGHWLIPIFDLLDAAGAKPRRLDSFEANSKNGEMRRV